MLYLVKTSENKHRLAFSSKKQKLQALLFEYQYKLKTVNDFTRTIFLSAKIAELQALISAC